MRPTAARTLDPWKGATERRQTLWRRLTPPQIFVGSFVILVIFGTLGLLLLPGIYTGDRLGFVDALFTATSAVCVTGLIVVDTATFFTPAGQAFILLLIQLGGLGILTLSTLLILALGRRLSLRQELLSRGGEYDVAPQIDTERLMRDVIRYTLLIEAIGATLLYALWVPRMGWGSAAWPAVFHAISAFCNAGFSVFSDSLIGFQQAPATLGLIGILVIGGGIGFLTLEEVALWRRLQFRRRNFRLSAHSRISLGVTAALLLLGWIGFALFEWRGVLAHLGTGHRLANAMFMSLTPRTAGFNSVDYGAVSESSSFLTILLMFVGGSPGSTAGGIKTTTFGLLILLAWSRMRGRDVVDIGGRTIPEETIQRAVGLALTVFALVTACIFVFTWTERAGALGGDAPDGFLRRMFESVSAFNTVGLSMNATPGLSTAGKVFTAVTMFVGRVGPLSFAAALAVAAHRRGPQYRYAYEDVVVG